MSSVVKPLWLLIGHWKQFCYDHDYTAQSSKVEVSLRNSKFYLNLPKRFLSKSVFIECRLFMRWVPHGVYCKSRLRDMWQAAHGLTGVVIYHTGNLIKFREMIIPFLTMRIVNEWERFNNYEVCVCISISVTMKREHWIWVNKFGIILKILSNSNL